MNLEALGTCKDKKGKGTCAKLRTEDGRRREPRGSRGPTAPQARGGGVGDGQQAALLLRARGAAPSRAAARGGPAWAALRRRGHACHVQPPQAKGEAPLPPLTPARGEKRGSLVAVARHRSSCLRGIRKRPSPRDGGHLRGSPTAVGKLLQELHKSN